MDSKLFPGLESRDLDARLNGYIQRALNEPAIVAADASVKDRMTTFLSLYYTFFDVVVRLANEPARIEVAESGAHAYNTDQLATMKELRDGYLAAYEELIVPVAPPIVTSLPGTRTGTTRQVW